MGRSTVSAAATSAHSVLAAAADEEQSGRGGKAAGEGTRTERRPPGAKGEPAGARGPSEARAGAAAWPPVKTGPAEGACRA